MRDDSNLIQAILDDAMSMGMPQLPEGAELVVVEPDPDNLYMGWWLVGPVGTA